MNYSTYQVSIVCDGGLKFLPVVASSIEAAIADVRDAYGNDVDVVAVCLA